MLHFSAHRRRRDYSFGEWFGFCVISISVKNQRLIRSLSPLTEPSIFTAAREPPFFKRLTAVSLPSVTGVHRKLPYDTDSISEGHIL